MNELQTEFNEKGLRLSIFWETSMKEGRALFPKLGRERNQNSGNEVRKRGRPGRIEQSFVSVHFFHKATYKIQLSGDV
jgi:hypothetical protein